MDLEKLLLNDIVFRSSGVTQEDDEPVLTLEDLDGEWEEKTREYTYTSLEIACSVP
jgi:hypothetical protein